MSVRARGKAPAKDTHTFTFATAATDLRMLRYEALDDPSFKNKSVGLAPNGNAVVTTITAEVVSATDPRKLPAFRPAASNGPTSSSRSS